MKKILFLLACSLLFVNLTAQEQQIQYDYIIVGNGTAGAVLARKLSDDLKTKVLVLEAGVNHDTDPAVLNTSGLSFFNDLNEISYNPKYAETYGVKVINPLQATVYTEGRGWGGGSMHNYLQAIRGTTSVYDNWATISGNPAWSYDNLLPLMLALENFTSNGTFPFDPTERGVGGPINITQGMSITADPFAIALAGASSTDAGFIDDINDSTDVSSTLVPQLGFSPFQSFATPGSTLGTYGQRSFSSNSFLPRSVVTTQGKAVDGRLLRIESNAFVSRVLFDGITATGVEFVYGDKGNKILKAYGKKIILCAGAINSPAILQRSGIGDPSLLGPLGIDVLVNNPNVGANLNNQYGVTAIVDGITTSGTTQPFLQGFVNGYSPMPLAGVLPGEFTYPTPQADPVRRLQIGATGTGMGGALVFGFILDPSSRGSVQIVTKNPLIQPNVNLNMYSDNTLTPPYLNGSDANLAITAYSIIEQAVNAGGGTMVFPPASAFADPSGAALFLGAATTLSGLVATSHICGTTMMTTSIQTGVVDGNLNVFGVKNLMVADLGIAPQMPDGNTCYAVYLIALRAATILGVPVPPAL